MAEHDDRVAILEELVGDQVEFVPGPDRLLQNLHRSVLALVRAAPGHVLRIATLPDEIVGPVGQRSLDVSLRELLIALPQQVALAGHCDTSPLLSMRWLSSHRAGINLP